MKMTRNTLTTAALAAAILAGTAGASAATAQRMRQTTVTGSLIPMQTVVVSTPSMSAIRRLAIQPIARLTDHGWSCTIIGAVYSDNAQVADGPMAHIATSLRSDGKTVVTRTNGYGVYHVVVPSDVVPTVWREARPQVGELPFGVHPSRPHVTCPAA